MEGYLIWSLGAGKSKHGERIWQGSSRCTIMWRVFHGETERLCRSGSFFFWYHHGAPTCMTSFPLIYPKLYFIDMWIMGLSFLHIGTFKVHTFYGQDKDHRKWLGSQRGTDKQWTFRQWDLRSVWAGSSLKSILIFYTQQRPKAWCFSILHWNLPNYEPK